MAVDPEARAAAHALVARYAVAANDPASSATALYRVYAVVSTNLRNAVGDDGTDALLSRAMARVDERHPAARDLRRTATANIDSAYLAAAVSTHGEAAIRAAIEEMLGTVIELLSRLIGGGMALRLIDHESGATSRPPTDEASA